MGGQSLLATAFCLSGLFLLFVNNSMNVQREDKGGDVFVTRAQNFKIRSHHCIFSTSEHSNTCIIDSKDN